MSEITRNPTLRKQVQNALKEDLRTLYKPGDHLPGERVLAKRFDVSILTIREAVQGLVDLNLVERRQGLGTIVLSPREALADLPIGILVEIDVTHPNVSPHYLTLGMRLKAELEEKGHRVRLFLGNLTPGETSPEPDCAEFIQALEENSLKAVVALSATSEDWRIRLEARGIPVVCLGGNGEWAVQIDKGYFIKAAIEELTEQGCSRLALITWDGRRAKNAPDRSEVFRKELQQAGLPANGRWIYAGVEPSLNGAGWEAMREVWSAEDERPDGLIITDDMLLQGALLAIHELRIRVPEQLSIVTLATRGQPNLGRIPTISYEMPIDEMVTNLVQLTAERLQAGDSPARIIRLRPERAESDETTRQMAEQTTSARGSLRVLAGDLAGLGGSSSL